MNYLAIFSNVLLTFSKVSTDSSKNGSITSGVSLDLSYSMMLRFARA